MLVIQPAVQQLTTRACSALAPVAWSTVRGGARALDLGRTKMRLDGLHQYGVVAALLMNAALRLFSSTPKIIQPNERKVDKYAKVAFTVAVALCVALGSYTSVVFALLGLYSKRALGMSKDAAFVEFFEATSSIRELSFDSFFYMLLCFKASFLLSIFLNYKDNPRLRWCVTVIVLAADAYAWWNWSLILKYAANLLLIRDL